MNESINIKSIISELKRLQEENDRHDYLKKQYKSFADQIELHTKEIQERLDKLNTIAVQLDPLRTVKPRAQRNGNIKNIAEDLFNKMKEGTHVTRKLIEATYGQELNNEQVASMLTKLKSFPGVHVANDGRAIRLYV